MIEALEGVVITWVALILTYATIAIALIFVRWVARHIMKFKLRQELRNGPSRPFR
jgi:hypothetical protein